MTHPSAGTAAPSTRHPRGLYTLFFTEMWERFSYYGMRALLVLFMVDATRGGMGLDDKTATAIYGLYTAAVYLMSLPGGWLADRILGAQRAVWYGGILIALGHFTLALPMTQAFYLGLILVVTGTGMLKPNMSTLVGELYPEGDRRRDSGFTIFYMGINLGAFIGPLVCSALGEKVNWHYGFAAAGVGMVLGLIQFHLTRSRLGVAGLEPGNRRTLNRIEQGGVAVVVGVAGLMILLGLAGILKLNAPAIARAMAYVILALAALYFAGVFFWAGLTRVEKERVGVILILFLTSALFWSGFEQAGSSFNLFAERYTQRTLGWLGGTIPTGWFQSLGPIFIITLAPVFAWLWGWLGRRNLEPSIPVKFACGLFLLASGFVVMAGAARVVAGGNKALPVWLITTYLVHTFGELCLSPVGLSSVTKLAPRKLAGQMMGIWFLASSFGNLLAGLLAGEFKEDNMAGWPALFLHIAVLPVIAGVLLIVCVKPIKRWMEGVR
jgi:POT family proton-dependent oligopeptide transporter